MHVLRKIPDTVANTLNGCAFCTEMCACACTSAVRTARTVAALRLCWMIFSYQYALLLCFLYSLDYLLLTQLASGLPCCLIPGLDLGLL